MGHSLATVLIADDNDDVRDLLSEFLEDSGYRVRPVADGEEALISFAALPADVVITDIRMPRRNGLQVLAAVKALRPSTPVILLTGQGGGDYDIEEAERLGAYACLTKPLRNILSLQDVVAAALAQSSTASVS